MNPWQIIFYHQLFPKYQHSNSSLREKGEKELHLFAATFQITYDTESNAEPFQCIAFLLLSFFLLAIKTLRIIENAQDCAQSKKREGGKKPIAFVRSSTNA